jgi:hypothetical protein
MDGLSDIDRTMTAGDEQDIGDAAAGRAGLVTQLRELEAFVARSDANGDELPHEAREMIERLREIVQALDGLTSSLGESAAPPDDAPPRDS